MREYIIVIAGAAVLSVFADMLSPKEWQKYIKIVTGLVIISVIIAPLAKFKDTDLFSEIGVQDEIAIDTADYSKMWVIDEFTAKIEEDIEERIKNEYGRDCTAKVRLRLNEDELIERVELVSISINSPPDGLKRRIMEIYGVAENEVIING